MKLYDYERGNRSVDLVGTFVAAPTAVPASRFTPPDQKLVTLLQSWVFFWQNEFNLRYN